MWTNLSARHTGAAADYSNRRGSLWLERNIPFRAWRVCCSRAEQYAELDEAPLISEDTGTETGSADLSVPRHTHTVHRAPLRDGRRLAAEVDTLAEAADEDKGEATREEGRGVGRLAHADLAHYNEADSPSPRTCVRPSIHDECASLGSWFVRQ